MFESERRFLPSSPPPKGNPRCLRQTYFSKERITIENALKISHQGKVQLEIPLLEAERKALLSTNPVVRIRQDENIWFRTAKGPKDPEWIF